MTYSTYKGAYSGNSPSIDSDDLASSQIPPNVPSNIPSTDTGKVYGGTSGNTPGNPTKRPCNCINPEHHIVKHQLTVGVDDIEKITELRDIHALLYPLIYLSKLYRNFTEYTSHVFSPQNFINLIVLIIVIFFMKYY